MNVLMINGSPNTKGCTFTALTEIGKTLQEQNINYEIMQLGKQPIRDCINCNRCHGDGCIFDDDMVNEFIQKAKNADGFVFGTPVYYAHPSGRLLSFLDRAFYSSASSRIYKPFNSNRRLPLSLPEEQAQLLPLMSSINIFPLL